MNSGRFWISCQYILSNVIDRGQGSEPENDLSSYIVRKPFHAYLLSEYACAIVSLGTRGHGLVRYSVAPNQPEVKNCTHKFDILATDPRVRYFGNVNVGDTHSSIPHTVRLPLSSLFENYTHVIFATGCAIPTRHPALSPTSPFCSTALSFVHWYTQHPSGPPAPRLDQLEHVSLIGNGNVALDVARMLLTPVSVLEKYDVPEPVLAVLAQSRVRHVSIVGRRGPLEAAFTTKELREMMNLEDSSMVPLDPEVFDPPTATTSATPVPAPTRQQARTLQLLRQGSKNPPGTTKKTWSLDFYRCPTLLTTPNGGSGTGTLTELTLAHTMVDPTTGRAVNTGEMTRVATSIVIPSLGFHADPKAPFMEEGGRHMRTSAGGRVVVAADASHGSDALEVGLKNVYASGWAATGAKGVLAATLMNAFSVAETVIADWVPGGIKEGALSDTTSSEEAKMVLNPDPHPDDPPPEIVKGLREGMVTDYEGWKRIDKEEMRRGAVVDKERERMGWEEARRFLRP